MNNQELLQKFKEYVSILDDTNYDRDVTAIKYEAADIFADFFIWLETGLSLNDTTVEDLSKNNELFVNVESGGCLIGWDILI